MNGVANATAGTLGLLRPINSESLEPSLHLGQPFHPPPRHEQGVSRCEMGELIFMILKHEHGLRVIST